MVHDVGDRVIVQDDTVIAIDGVVVLVIIEDVVPTFHREKLN